MSSEILKRLQMLEAAANLQKIPSKPEFLEFWHGLSDLDKSLYILQAENLETMTENRAYKEYMEAVAKYLQEMGLVDPNAPKLLDIAAEMENGNV